MKKTNEGQISQVDNANEINNCYILPRSGMIRIEVFATPEDTENYIKANGKE